LSRLAASFVLGYHGCDAEVARAAIAGEVRLLSSDKKYDWLGPGIYFWEANPQRAFEWVANRCGDPGYNSPGVIGAVIDLRNCLDLLNHADLLLVRQAYDSLAELHAANGTRMPRNRNAAGGGDKDRRARQLDREVIKHLHGMMDYPSEALDGDDVVLTPHFDTVRGMFIEGDPLYPGAAFYSQSHVQIAVRTYDCILGLFHPPVLG
jgi:hypothetical protein